jgi:4-hydroxybenzoate polyprenyltransferase
MLSAVYRLTDSITRYRAILSLLYLAALGALCVYSVEAYFGLDFSPLLLFVCVCLILGIYLLNRVSDIQEDFNNDTSRLIFYEKQRLYLYGSVGLLGLAMAILIVTQHFHWIYPSLLGLGICYSYPIIPILRAGRIDFKRLKDITLVKNLAVALLWGLCVVLVPIAYAGESAQFSNMAWYFSIALTLSTFTNTLFDDMLDEPGDRLAGVMTLPVLMGLPWCYGLLLTVGVGWGIILGLSHFLGWIGGGHALFLECLAAYPLLYMGAHKLMPLRKTLVDMLSESDLLFFGVGLIVLASIK